MSSKLTIAVLCDSIDTVMGGSYISAKRFAKGLADQGHKIIRCTSKFINPKQKEEEFGYASIYEFPGSAGMGPQKVRFALASSSKLRKIFIEEKVDIVYNIHPAPIGRQGYRASKKLSIPMVSHSHVAPEGIVPNAGHRLQTYIYRLFSRFYRKSKGLVFPSLCAQKQFSGYHLPTEIIVSNGVDSTLFYPGERKTKIPFNVLYVGRLDHDKNASLLIEALHLLQQQNKLTPEICCTIVGSGEEEKKLKELVHTYQLDTFIHFTGKIQNDKLVNFYQEGDLFVLTSLAELESMTTLEAIACGCPILVADTQRNAATAFVQGNGYTFDPRQPQDLADKIYTLSKDPALVQSMSQKSLEIVDEFTFSKSVQKLEDFFHSFRSL